VFVRLGCKSLPGSNTSLLQKFVNYRQKSFITLGPGCIFQLFIEKIHTNTSSESTTHPKGTNKHTFAILSIFEICFIDTMTVLIKTKLITTLLITDFTNDFTFNSR
jgi:hypothetical protein